MYKRTSFSCLRYVWLRDHSTPSGGEWAGRPPAPERSSRPAARNTSHPAGSCAPLQYPLEKGVYQRELRSLGFLNLRRFGADPDPDQHLWLTDLDPDTTLDPTSFYSDFKDAKKNIFFIFFLITYPQAHNLKIKFLAKMHYYRPLNTFMRKGKDPDLYSD